MHVQIKRWGNSLGFRIPRSVAKDAAVNEGAEVDVRVTKGRIVITPVRRRRYSLKELLAKVTRKNLHSEIDFGTPRGKEIW